MARRSACFTHALFAACLTAGSGRAQAETASADIVQSLTAPDGEVGSYFGFAVALSGTTALVGAPFHGSDDQLRRGAAYVFVQDGASFVAQGEPLVTSLGGSGDRFGAAVALSGDVALVGAPQYDVGDNVRQGAVFVFEREGERWFERSSVLIAADGAENDGFGSTLALSGDTAVIGAPTRAGGQGAAYVFARHGGDWVQQGPALAAASVGLRDAFGSSVALSDDTALVGAPIHQVAENQYQGSVYVFARTEAGWTEQGPALIAPDSNPFAQLGPCALSGETALVGSPYQTIGGNAAQGAALAFVRSESHWEQQGPPLVPSGGEVSDEFGTSVALAGDTALILAAGRKAGTRESRGSAYVFRRSNGVWAEAGAPIVVSDGEDTDTLGPALALSESTALIGSPFQHVGENSNQGKVYVLSLTEPPPVASSAESGRSAGCEVAGARDRSRSALAAWIGLFGVALRRAARRRLQ